jgi:acetyltransferase EpsM
MSRPAPLIVIGGGEHARVVMDAARSRPQSWQLVGFCDPADCAETARRFGVPWLGDDEAAPARAPADARFVIGVGAVGPSEHRGVIAERFAARGVRWATLVHRAATIADTVTCGEGMVVLAGAVVNTGAVIGEHAVINTGAIVEHDVLVGAFAQLAPGSVVGGGVSIGEAAFIGLGSRVRDHVKIGTRAWVGMGAVVVRSVADGERVLGVPARSRTP